MKNIAFVSVGNISHKNAELLVKSIKKTNLNCRIIQISTKEDREIIGVDEILIFKFEASVFMLNRFESQIKIVEKYGPTIFLDTDMLVNKDLKEVFNLLKKNDFIFTKRENNHYMNDTFANTKYPEFTNKTTNDVMPFNAGFIGSNNATSLERLLKICLNLPQRFHYWYGDQVAQKKIYDTKEFKILVLDSKYNYMIEDVTEFDQNIYVYHFKGKYKESMEPFYHKFFEFCRSKT